MNVGPIEQAAIDFCQQNTLPRAMATQVLLFLNHV
jgi:hypothetical protein